MTNLKDRSLNRMELQMIENVNYRLREEESLCKLKSRLESFWLAGDDSDDYEAEYIDQLLRSKEWNQLVKQSTTSALPKTADWTVTKTR